MRGLGAAGVRAAAISFVLAIGAETAAAAVIVNIDKSAQRMSVAVHGETRNTWRVSTGLGGGPPSCIYRPQRLARSWYSRKYHWSPMPYSIFFHKGYAIHGTLYVSRLGRRASHGCVRLHPSHAAMLYGLVKQEGVDNTRIVVSR